MRIGVDFDNTIVCYDTVFHRVAVEQGLIPPDVPASKWQVRDYLRREGREDQWTELQGYIYGARMLDAPAFPGAMEFFTRCVRGGIPVYIISHRTHYPFIGVRFDLHRAAAEWLTSKGFYHRDRVGMPAENVHFELTKKEKMGRIAQTGCTHFIDDLPEFLGEPGFPEGVERILFDPNNNCADETRFQRASSWAEIAWYLFGR